MTRSQRLLVSTVLIIFSVGLPWHFIEYRAEDANARHVAQGLILGLGEGYRPHNPSDPQPPPPDGFQIVTQRGIYARRDYTIGPAAIGGLVVPILLLGAACYLILGYRKFSN